MSAPFDLNTRAPSLAALARRFAADRSEANKVELIAKAMEMRPRLGWDVPYSLLLPALKLPKLYAERCKDVVFDEHGNGPYCAGHKSAGYCPLEIEAGHLATRLADDLVRLGGAS